MRGSLDVDDRRCSNGGDAGLGAVFGADPGKGEGGVAGGNGLEGEDADGTLTGDAGGSGRTGGGDGDETVALVAVNDGDGLAIAARRSPESTLTSWRTAGLNWSWRGTE